MRRTGRFPTIATYPEILFAECDVVILSEAERNLGQAQR